MTEYVTSLIRTYVPILVGSVASWLVTLGVEVDSGTQAALVAGLTGVLIAVYYTVVRLAETRWPQIGKLLGRAKAPTYDA